ncbi:MAG TPA: MmgE/PrpD family protein [Bryobacteraceae bacterium]|nr:MmgE/PrpD family protein [Bryobacteraceae bacterium]HOL72182.1 MmgE/PrpD family protein [Bryobacteraceae bacterium]HOQ46661.1 MmgE/PrpD family protein [Bryobacteraceae bacterium]HPQ14645.1 MmgE/PrpD family protein [Bryobacteraceae bacterium]HPU72331.1 MmgE/PrpD family protein [Bryobacteraceae bacterium]
MTRSEELAEFAVRASYDDLSGEAREALKIRVLDSLGCAIGALGGEPVRLVRQQIDEFGGAPLCTLVGGGKTAPDRAAFYNGALVRYLDFNDSYLAKGETCHPSDNVAPVLAAAEYANRSGREFLVALAVAYQVQCRLSDVAPVRDRGFDHTTQGSYAAAAGVSRALGLDRTRTAHAIGIAGAAFNALRVTRTGALSHWKGLAYPNTAFGCTHAAFLAMRGVTGPLEVFEGNKGFMDSIAGRFEIDWSREGFERVRRTILKKYNAEVHSQSAIEAVLELRWEGFRPEEIERIELDTFDVAHKIIGGGEEGDKTVIRTKEEADHSLPYLLAVAILDGEVMPEQYAPERILRDDVQRLLRKVIVRPRTDLSQRFPAEVPAEVRVVLRGGRMLEARRSDYEGFLTRPVRWEAAVQKFERLAASFPSSEIAAAVANLESIRVAELARLLEGEPK